MKIGIAGAFSTGKTTLTKKLGKELKDYKVITNTEREVAELLGFNFNNHGKKQRENYQKWLIQTILNEVENDMITDTPLHLMKGYCENKKIQKTINKYLPTLYDILFYLPIEFDIENDGIRHIDKEYQKEVDKKIQNELEYSCKHNDKLIVKTLHGDINKRLQQAKSFLNLN